MKMTTISGEFWQTSAGVGPNLANCGQLLVKSVQARPKCCRSWGMCSQTGLMFERIRRSRTEITSEMPARYEQERSVLMTIFNTWLFLHSSTSFETSPTAPFTSTMRSPFMTFWSGCASFHATTKPPVKSSTRRVTLSAAGGATPLGDLKRGVGSKGHTMRGAVAQICRPDSPSQSSESCEHRPPPPPGLVPRGGAEEQRSEPGPGKARPRPAQDLGIRFRRLSHFSFALVRVPHRRGDARCR